MIPQLVYSQDRKGGKKGMETEIARREGRPRGGDYIPNISDTPPSL
jgi:hypothetical protein